MTQSVSDFLPVHLVDDDAGVARAFQFLLAEMDQPVHYWPESSSFLAEADLHEPAVVILDMRMPAPDGAQVHAELRRREACLGGIILTGHGDVDMAVEQMKQGAVDFLQKPVGAEALTTALERASQRARAQAAGRALARRAARLSPREREIAELICQGLPNREIASALNVAVRTVEVHRSRVVEKLGAANSAELAALWQRLRHP